MAAADFGVHDEVAHDFRVSVELVEDVVDVLLGYVVSVPVFDVVSNRGVNRLDFGCPRIVAVPGDAIGRRDVKFHQSGKTVVFLIVEPIVFVLILFLVAGSTFGIVRVLRLDKGIERQLVFVDLAGYCQIAGNFHDGRIDFVFVFFVIQV